MIGRVAYLRLGEQVAVEAAMIRFAIAAEESHLGSHPGGQRSKTCSCPWSHALLDFGVTSNDLVVSEFATGDDLALQLLVRSGNGSASESGNGDGGETHIDVSLVGCLSCGSC